MTWDFFSSEDSDFENIGGCIVSTDTNRFNSTYSRCALRAYGAGWWRRTLKTARTAFWAQCVFYLNGSGTQAGLDQSVMRFMDKSDGTLPGRRGHWEVAMTNGRYQLQTFNGATWDVLASGAIAMNGTTVSTLRVEVSIHASTGVFNLWQDDIPVLSYTGDTTAVGASTCDRLEIDTPAPQLYASSYQVFFSQVIFGDESPAGLFCVTRPPVSDGAHTDWGAYDSIDEVVQNDGDSQQASLAAELQTYNTDDIPTLPVGHIPLAVQISSRVKRSAGGPQNFRPMTREAAVDYPWASVLLDDFYSTQWEVRALNPATGSNWSEAEVNANEYGHESLT